jgi:hypothetical protein
VMLPILLSHSNLLLLGSAAMQVYDTAECCQVTLFTMQSKGYDIECTQSVLLLQLCLCYADGDELVLLILIMRVLL